VARPRAEHRPGRAATRSSQFDAGFLAHGEYRIQVTTPWDEMAERYVVLRPGKPVETVEIVCPSAAEPEFDVRLDIEWPEDLRALNLGILLERDDHSRKLADLDWDTASGAADWKYLLVTNRGITLPMRFNPSRGRAGRKSRPDSSALEPEDDVYNVHIEEIRPLPTSGMHVRGAKCALHLTGILIFEKLRAYSDQRLFVAGPEGDSPEVLTEFSPDASDPHLTIAISPALAANVRRVLARGANFDATPISTRRPTNSDTLDTILDYALLSEQQGAVEEALASYVTAIEASPTDPSAYTRRGRLRITIGQIDQGIEDFSEAIRLDPEDARSAYSERGDALSGIGHLDRALADYAKSIRLKPDYWPAYVSRAGVWARKGEPRKALADYTEAIRLAEQNMSYWWGSPPYGERAAMLAELGETDEAIEAYGDTIIKRNSNEDARIGRGKLWWRKNDLDKATQDFAEAVRTDKHSHTAHDALGRFLATADDPRYRNARRALEHATRACDLSDWRSSGSLDTLAAAHAEAGDFALAAAWQAKAIELMQRASEKPSATDQKRSEERLELYRAGKPYREQVSPATKDAARDAKTPGGKG